MGGSVADATITGLLCEGVASPQSTGLGGGFVLTIYNKAKNHVETLIARDVAPLAATENMFANTTVTGAKAISVPGELKGYWELHQRYGKLKWSQLFDPIIDLCRKGHVVSRYLANILINNRKTIRASPTLSAIYINPKTNEPYRIGDVIKRNKLADTLEIIKWEGVDAMYNNGTLAKMLVEDIQAAGGIITVDDLMAFNVRWEKPITIPLKDRRTLHTLPLPGSGALLTYILNILNEYLPRKESALSLHRIAESFKFAYAQRTKLGDVKFVENVAKVVENLTDYQFAMATRRKINDFMTSNDVRYYGANFTAENDRGTSHINIIGPNGDAIAATGSINNVYDLEIRMSFAFSINDLLFFI